MEPRNLERYKRRTIVLHWAHAVSFVLLVLTGAVMFVPGTGASGGFSTEVAHRAAAAVFVAGPVIYMILYPRAAWSFVKETFDWGKEDWGWFRAAPGYYFGGAEDRMPPQGHINTGQRMWQLVIIMTGIVFLVTGALMLFARSSLPLITYQWALFAHAVAFVAVLVMFLVHLYLGLFHPRTRGGFAGIIDGRVTPSYARDHYLKWYTEVTGSKNEEL